MMRRAVWPVLLGTLLASAISIAGAVDPVPCSEATSPAGGEWRSYGGGLDNARNQPATTGFNAGNAAALEPAWFFKATDVIKNGGVAQTQSPGAFSNTPVIADGCLFLASNTGWVWALNADTGAFRWKQKFSGAGQTLLGGVIVGSPVVANGVVYVGVSRPGRVATYDANGNLLTPATGPYVAAMDEHTGAVLWESVVEAGQINAAINASPVYFNGMIFQGFFGNEGGPVARGGFAILDASAQCAALVAPSVCNNPGGTGGTILKHTYTIDDDEYAAGYRGASVWCTAAVDPVEEFIYACGGNPASKKLESRYSNALLKIDGARQRKDLSGNLVANPAFGEVVLHYKGNVDQYFPGLDRQPACDLLGDKVVYVAWSATCLQLDLDFGSSPNLFPDEFGRLVLGDLQKSGVYHAVFTDHMQPKWTAIAGAPCFACNAASPAIQTKIGAGGSPDPENKVFTAATPPAQMVALTQQGGRYRWAFPIGTGTHFQAVSTSAGVVFTMDNAATLNMFDAETGLLLNRIPFAAIVRSAVADAGSTGVAIARNTVYASSSEYVIAFR